MASKSASLEAVQEQGWRMGFANLFREASREWWGTRQWIVQSIIWLLIVNGIVAAVVLAPPGEQGQSPGITGVEIFFMIGAMAFGIGVTIIGQGVFLDEKKSGTLAWVLSKPVSRPAFFFAKLLANGLGILVTMVLLQGAVAYLIISLTKGSALPLLPFIGGLILLALYITFFFTLTLMLGVLSDSRGAVIGIPMALIFGYQFIAGLAPFLMQLLPFPLVMTGGPESPSLASMLVNQQPLPSALPILATIAGIIAFVVIALRRFDAMEF